MSSEFAQETLEAAEVFSARAEERRLIQRAQQGDPEAVAELYYRHAPAVFRYVYFRMNDSAAAEDLTGEVFVRMMEALRHYTERGTPFAAWLFRIARARVVDYQRGTARRPTVQLSELIVDHVPGPEAQVADQLEAHYLVKALTTLTDEQRGVIQLRFVEGYNLEDTAQLLRKSTGAIKALQHRALQNLARKLKT
ncbi:MAG: sigma-70 family RNA polymerase sigma factor [Anaerolineales bacterium]